MRLIAWHALILLTTGCLLPKLDPFDSSPAVGRTEQNARTRKVVKPWRVAFDFDGGDEPDAAPHDASKPSEPPADAAPHDASTPPADAAPHDASTPPADAAPHDASKPPEPPGDGCIHETSSISGCTDPSALAAITIVQEVPKPTAPRVLVQDCNTQAGYVVYYGQGEACDPEVYVVGIYEGLVNRSSTSALQPGSVHVARRSRPVVLVLSSYEPMAWRITQDDCVTLRKVFVSDYSDLSTVEISLSVPVEKTRLRLGYGSDEGGGNTPELLKGAATLAGAPVTAFGGCYAASTVTIPDVASGPPADPCEVVVRENMFDVHTSSLGFASSCTTRKLTIARQATIGASTIASAALVVDGPVPITVQVQGAIIGAGGEGGSGGNGGGGSGRYCGRDGLPGGPAISLLQDVTIVVEAGGLIAGGGGGGGGVSGGNLALGGGGGAGLKNGHGGAGATLLSEADELAFCNQDNGVRTGTPGENGTTFVAGKGGKSPDRMLDMYCPGAGDGGGLGQPGAAGECFSSSRGGTAGAAIVRNHFSAGIADGAYSDPTGPIRGAVRE